MVSEIELLEQVEDEIRERKPQEHEGANAGITFPFAGDVRLSNFIRFFHPDGTWSDLAAPTYNPHRPTPYRKRFLQNWLGKLRNGQRWFFLEPQAKAPELPIHCFVEPGGVKCTKRLRNIPDLYMHVISRHFEESKLYADVLDALKRKMQMQIEPGLVAAMGLGPDMESPAPPEKAEVEIPELFYCRNEGCKRFFDTAQGLYQHGRSHKEAS